MTFSEKLITLPRGAGLVAGAAREQDRRDTPGGRALGKGRGVAGCVSLTNLSKRSMLRPSG